jgi:hypothetical protein
VSFTGKSRFDSAKVVALKMQNDARRLEIKFADAAGTEHIVSLPIPAAVELATFIGDACSFMTRLKSRPQPSSEN